MYHKARINEVMKNNRFISDFVFNQLIVFFFLHYTCCRYFPTNILKFPCGKGELIFLFSFPEKKLYFDQDFLELFYIFKQSKKVSSSLCSISREKNCILIKISQSSSIYSRSSHPDKLKHGFRYSKITKIVLENTLTIDLLITQRNLASFLISNTVSGLLGQLQIFWKLYLKGLLGLLIGLGLLEL